MFEIDDKDAVTRQLRIVSIEELEQLSLQHGWDAHYTQLGASSRPGSYLESRFGSILVTRTAYPGAVSVKSGVPPGYVGISLHLFAAPAKIKGEATADNRLFVGMPGVDYEVITRDVGEAFTMIVPRDEIESRLGTSFSILEESMLRPLYCSARLDEAELEPVRRWYREWIASPVLRDQKEAAARQRFLNYLLTGTLSHLVDLVEPGAVDIRKHLNGNRKIADLIDYFHAFPDRPVSLDDMMRLTSLRRRTLFHRFREYTGYTPYQYFRLLRLGFAHRDILADVDAITGLAFKYHFDHLGDFSAFYKSVYARLPSEERKFTRLLQADGSPDTPLEYDTVA